MNGLKIYAALVRLYPHEHQKRYGQQMQHMLEDAPSGSERLAVWGRIIMDLLLSLYKEHMQVIGENMQTKNYGTKIGVIVGALAAFIGLGFPLYNRQAAASFNSDALRLPTPMDGFLLPSLALLLVSVTFFVSKTHSEKQLSAGYARLSAGVAAIALINIMILVFDLTRR